MSHPRGFPATHGRDAGLLLPAADARAAAPHSKPVSQSPASRVPPLLQHAGHFADPQPLLVQPCHGSRRQRRPRHHRHHRQLQHHQHHQQQRRQRLLGCLRLWGWRLWHRKCTQADQEAVLPGWPHALPILQIRPRDGGVGWRYVNGFLFWGEGGEVGLSSSFFLSLSSSDA